MIIEYVLAGSCALYSAHLCVFFPNREIEHGMLDKRRALRQAPTVPELLHQSRPRIRPASVNKGKIDPIPWFGPSRHRSTGR